MSPAISTVILIAITIVLSLAVGAWLKGISTEYMRVEAMSLDSAFTTFGTDPTLDDDTITAYIRNSGKDLIDLDEAYVDGILTLFVADPDPLSVDKVSTVIITFPPSTLVLYETYEVKIVSTRGTQLVFSVRAEA